MTDPQIRALRTVCGRIVTRANENLSCKLAEIRYQAYAVGETVGVTGEPDSQQEINKNIDDCNLFVMILKNGERIGSITLAEYKRALLKSCESVNGEPYIKIYLIKEHESDPVYVPYIMEDLNPGAAKVKQDDNFEERIYIDSKRYLDIVCHATFGDHLYDYLTQTYIIGKKKFRQSEISYQQHISGTYQAELRSHKHKYFRRENIDDKLERVAEESSLIILEGNVYSGKTYAAYELMKQEKWKDAIFYVYRCNHDSALNDLNLISFNSSDSPRNKVILIDDINDAFRDGKTVDGRCQLWSELRSLSSEKLPNWPKTTVIITIAGCLSDKEKDNLYEKIFGESYDALQSMLERLTVNFDIYDRSSFKKMVNEMVRHGVIPMNDVRSGNYTIGSLFIKDEVIRNIIKRKVVDNEAMRFALKTISLNWKYASRELKGSIPEMKRLYQSLTKLQICEINHPLVKCLEELRVKGLVFINNDKVLIDSFVIDAINYVLGPDAVDTQSLIDYAAETMKEENKGENLSKFTCVEQMGYYICEGAALSDDSIKSLVKQVYCKIYACGYDKELDETAVAELMMSICLKQNHTVYSRNFCATAALKMSDFEFAYKVMLKAKEEMLAKEIKAQKQSDEAKRAKSMLAHENYKILYKSIAYALISQQRYLNMCEEKLVLAEIFSEIKDGRKKFSFPFEESDLETMHVLKRMIPHLERSIEEIIHLAENARPNVDAPEDESDDDFPFEQKNSNVQDAQNERIFLSQLRKVVISAMKKSENFNEFESIVKRLGETRSDFLQQALSGYFAILFYSNAADIVCKYSYRDRFKFFEFIINLQDSSCIIEHESFVHDSDLLKHTEKKRTIALNSMLELLDESDALEAYYRMSSENKADGYTSSILFKNEFLTFEQLLHVASSGEGKHLIQNQLLAKAQTIDDSRACLRLMGISDADPSRLKDQYALGHYLSCKFIGLDDCFDIVKRWKEKHDNQTLNVTNLGIISEKMSYGLLKEFFEGNASDLDKYGLCSTEVKEIRSNPICNQLLFNKACEVPGQGIYIKERMEKLICDDTLRPIVVDNRLNSGTCILAAYLRNKEIFPTYEDALNWWQAFYEIYSDEKRSGTLRKTSYIYKALLYRIQELAPTNGKEWFRKETNSLLVEAYEYFAQHYGKNKVISEMSQLYNFILRAMDEEDIDKPLEYVYETECKVQTLPEYLKLMLNGTTAYANGTFVYYALRLMNKGIHDEVMDYITKIAKKNKSGITLESIISLHKKIAWNLINIKKGEIYVNKDLISNYSDIKLLWWLLDSGKINYSTAKKYLERNKQINVTQTYLNKAFSQIHKAYKKNAYDEMKALLDKYVSDDSPGFYKSIQMFLSMIQASKTEEQLQETLRIFPEEYKKVDQYLGAVMQTYLAWAHVDSSSTIDGRVLLEKLEEHLISNKDMVTVHHINPYIKALMMILGNDVIVDNELRNVAYKRMRFCWEYMNNNKGYINVAQLLELADMDWTLKSDVQTYTCFPMFEPLLPVRINEIFNENYSYAKNKICLRDCIKNFSKFCGECYCKEAVDAFAKVLAKESNKGVRREICSRDLLYTRGSIPKFYLDLAAACHELVEEMRDYISQGYIGYSKIKYLLENEERISQLRDLLKGEESPPLLHNDNKNLYNAIFG